MSDKHSDGKADSLERVSLTAVNLALIPSIVCFKSKLEAVGKADGFEHSYPAIQC